ncbi:hypothetical protein [Catellatospora vulcania]|uniref:hypothetical protein n=1 Tax=Catellatospora vulcania TaxID=1460450 RepID=UPI0012D44466|nr:hypothetical protein [Catellatospora vulcania]
MNRNKALGLASRLAAGLAVVGFAVIGLTYAVAVPEWIIPVYLAAAVVTIGIGAVLCYPYLDRGGYPGFVLSDRAGKPARWLVALPIIAVLVVAALVVTSGLYGVRGAVAAVNVFVCVMAMWCGAAANARPNGA